MAEELPSKDFHHLTCSLVTEFGKNRCCCALSREGKIHTVHQVHIHSDAVDDYIYPYEQFLSEAVAAGRIEAPGFFDDPTVRQAWCGCDWRGANMGHVDPLKEVKAAEGRIRNNITTQEQEASEYNGNDWAANVRQRKREVAVMREMGLDGAEKSDDSTGEDPGEEEED